MSNEKFKWEQQKRLKSARRKQSDLSAVKVSSASGLTERDKQLSQIRNFLQRFTFQESGPDGEPCMQTEFEGKKLAIEAGEEGLVSEVITTKDGMDVFMELIGQALPELAESCGLYYDEDDESERHGANGEKGVTLKHTKISCCISVLDYARLAKAVHYSFRAKLPEETYDTITKRLDKELQKDGAVLEVEQQRAI